MIQYRDFEIIRDGKPIKFKARLEPFGNGVTATIDGVRGLFAIGDNYDHAVKQLQGALILHIDGCDEDGISIWDNDPDLGCLE